MKNRLTFKEWFEKCRVEYAVKCRRIHPHFDPDGIDMVCQSCYEDAKFDYDVIVRKEDKLLAQIERGTIQ